MGFRIEGRVPYMYMDVCARACAYMCLCTQTHINTDMHTHTASASIFVCNIWLQNQTHKSPTSVSKEPSFCVKRALR